jgi:hypothetical protein
MALDFERMWQRYLADFNAMAKQKGLYPRTLANVILGAPPAQPAFFLADALRPEKVEQLFPHTEEYGRLKAHFLELILHDWDPWVKKGLSAEDRAKAAGAKTGQLRRRRGAETSAKIAKLEYQLLAEGHSPRTLNKVIAQRLRLSPQYVGRVRRKTHRS